MASVLEQYVNTVRTESSLGNFNALIEYLRKSNEVLQKNIQHLDNVLETLDIQQHSLGYLFVLIVKCGSMTSESGQQQEHYAHVPEFIANCNGEQIRLTPDIFAELCHHFTNYLVENDEPMKGIIVLQKAISKLRLFDSQLTSIHSDLCQLCLLGKCFKPALGILDVDITGICQENTPSLSNGSSFDARYFLQYYYYGGMIYLAVRNLDRALYFFEVAITTPAQAVSHIMLESYKKYIIVSLLSQGKLHQLPRYASQVVGRFIKPLSQPYRDLANAFATNSSSDLASVINKHREVFVRDRNYGLVKQISSVLYKKNIQKLTKTFLTLSLSDVASRVGLPGPQDAERYILHMIQDQQIFATINQKDGMVIFRDEPQKYGGPEVLQNIEKQLSTCMELDKQILAMDEEIQVNPMYVKKASGAQDEEQPSKSTYAM